MDPFVIMLIGGGAVAGVLLAIWHTAAGKKAMTEIEDKVKAAVKAELDALRGKM